MNLKFKFSFIIALVLLQVPIGIYATNPTSRKESERVFRVLVLPLENNVKSNYFVKDMLAEEINISVDSVESVYNQTIIKSISEFTSKSNVKIVNIADKQVVNNLIKQIKLVGQDEDVVSDFKQVDPILLNQLLEDSDSEYILILNQHYLKHQDKPMKTIFHIISYSVFDKNRKEITSGNNYFTYMKLNSPDDISKLSKKTVSKIISSIDKALM